MSDRKREHDDRHVLVGDEVEGGHHRRCNKVRYPFARHPCSCALERPDDSSEKQALAIARLAYRLGRQDQQRILEHRLRKHFGSNVQANLLRDIAEGMTDALVDFGAIVGAVQKEWLDGPARSRRI